MRLGHALLLAAGLLLSVPRAKAESGSDSNSDLDVANLWTGFYGGAQFGWVWPEEGKLGDGGVLYGGQAGYLWQSGRLVIGVEIDLARSALSNSASAATSVLGIPIAGSSGAELDWLASARGRVGYLLAPHVMVYLTGGPALGSTNANLNVTVANVSVLSGSADYTNFGWVAGGGFEALIWNHISFKAEGFYGNLGDKDLTLTGTGIAAGLNGTKLTYETEGFVVRTGLNFHFGKN